MLSPCSHWDPGDYEVKGFMHFFKDLQKFQKNKFQDITEQANLNVNAILNKAIRIQMLACLVDLVIWH